MINLEVNKYQLSIEQLKPVIDNPHTSIIIAGAGSGKTLTIIGKLKYIEKLKLYKPEEVLLLTFTNAAVQNLNKQIANNCDKEYDTYTFHKLALNILDDNTKIEQESTLEYIVNEFFNSYAIYNKFINKTLYKLFPYIIRNNKNNHKILSSNKLTTLKKNITTFIRLLKTENKTINSSFFTKKEEEPFLIITYIIYNLYEKEKESTNSLDFDDIIIKATNNIKDNKKRTPYKMIIIDEFQDTSLIRLNLIKEIAKQNNASICVVGDDYQSIYRFSGCNINLFLNFSNHFLNAKTYYLKETYRNSAELINTAGKFIMKNPYQLKKELTSSKHYKNPIKIIYYNNTHRILYKLLDIIPNEKQIFILGRSNFDLNPYLNNYTLNNHKLTIPNDNHILSYYTIHSSKGLESDIVILLNVSNSINGIPSKHKEEKVFKHVLNKETFKNEEERRLFYVALTRCKECIYLLTPYNNPSIFIKEIKHDKNVEIKKML